MGGKRGIRGWKKWNFPTCWEKKKIKICTRNTFSHGSHRKNFPPFSPFPLENFLHLDSAWLPEVPESVAYRASLSFGYSCCVYIFGVYVLDCLLDCSYLYIEFMFHYIFTMDSSCLGHLLAPPVFTFFHFPLHDFDFWIFRFWVILTYISYSITFYYILYSMFIYSDLCFAVSLHCLCFWFYIMFWCL